MQVVIYKDSEILASVFVPKSFSCIDLMNLTKKYAAEHGKVKAVVTD